MPTTSGYVACVGYHYRWHLSGKAALGTGTNWDSVMDEVKDFSGVPIQSL